jgi:septal ring factor EnvC (AmiA/AmiB activator)
MPEDLPVPVEIEKMVIPSQNDGMGKSLVALVSVISALLGIVGLVFAMVEPMGQRIDFLEKQLTEVQRLTSEEKDENSTVRTRLNSDISSMNEKFTEVETKFKALKELMENKIATLQREIDILQDCHRSEKQLRLSRLYKELDEAKQIINSIEEGYPQEESR